MSLDDLQQKVQASGYGLLIEDIKEEDIENIQKEAYQQLKRKTAWAGILALPVFLIGMFRMHMPYGNYIMWALTTPILLVFGNQFFKQAWLLAKNRKANMDTLVALNTGIALNTQDPTVDQKNSSYHQTKPVLGIANLVRTNFSKKASPL